MPAAEFLAFKIVATLTVVLGIAWITERFGPRAGAIASGFPNTMALILLFNGIALGSGFINDGIPFALAALSAPLVFGTTWGFASHLPLPLVTAPIVALIAYGIAAYSLSLIPFTFVSGIGFIVLAIGFFHLLNHLFPDKPLKTMPMNRAEFLFRVFLVLTVVLTVSGAAGYLGPKYAGILSVFPANVLPLFIILQRRYGGEPIRAFMRHWPEKMLSAAAYLIVLHFLLMQLPFFAAWLLALSGSLVCVLFFVKGGIRWPLKRMTKAVRVR